MSLAAEMATDLMLSRARSVNRLEVRNALGDYPGAPDLGTPEAEALAAEVLENIQTFGIEIITEGP